MEHGYCILRDMEVGESYFNDLFNIESEIFTSDFSPVNNKITL